MSSSLSTLEVRFRTDTKMQGSCWTTKRFLDYSYKLKFPRSFLGGYFGMFLVVFGCYSNK